MSFKPHYTSLDFEAALDAAGIQRGAVLYLTGKFGSLGYHESGTKAGALQGALLGARAILGRQGTLVVPTHSFSLCNTDTVFDPLTTRSETGPFTEHVRLQPGAVRQFHPFASVTALGADAGGICGNTSRHAYGPRTPFERLIAAGAWCVSLGMPPNRTCSAVHHIEQLMAVPYRYTKEFIQPVKRPGEVRSEPFYLFVTRRDVDLVRDQNEKLFRHPLLASGVRSVPLGLDRIHAYRLRDFQQAACDLMSGDLYSWLRRPPDARPFQS